MNSLLQAVQKHARMCADFECMGTGEFRQKYPDYRMSRQTGHGPEGVGYLTRHAADLAMIARAALTQGTGEAV